MPANETNNTNLDNTSIAESFQADKDNLTAEVSNYLKDFSISYLNKNISQAEEKNLRNTIPTQFNTKEDFIEAITKLERLRDLKNGIVTTQITSTGSIPILIRDARAVLDPGKLSTEAFEMQYLNVIRAAIDIADIEKKGTQVNEDISKELKARANIFMQSFHEGKENLSQSDIAEAVNKEIVAVIKFLEKKGIEDARDKVNVAKDFQNLKSDQSNIATISTIKDAKGKNHTVIEAETALRRLTADQLVEYQEIKKHYDPAKPSNDNPNLPKWFKALRPFEKELCVANFNKITDGKHVLSTQLRQINGMKNAFEKTTAIYNEDAKGNELKILHSSKHAGTIASFARGDDDKIRDGERERITLANSKQAQEWIGMDKRLHCLTLNSGPDIGTSTDKTIVSSTIKAMSQLNKGKANAGRETNLAFNALRIIGETSIYTGLNDTIAEIQKSYGQALGSAKLNKLDNVAVNKVSNQYGLGSEAAEIFKDMVAIQKMINKADRTIRLDLKNLSADIVVAQTNLISRFMAARDLPEQQTRGINFSNITIEEPIIMCASGKDRTGFAEHDISARKIQNAIGDIDLRDVDKQLLRSRHTANQAGSINAGGASIGAMGTKFDNIQSLPIQLFSNVKNRFNNLQAIIETTASGNNLPQVKADKKIVKVIEQTQPSKIAGPRSTPPVVPIKLNKTKGYLASKLKDAMSKISR